MSWIAGLLGAVLAASDAIDVINKDVKNSRVKYVPHDGGWKDGDDSVRRYAKKQRDKAKLIEKAIAKGVKRVYIYKLKDDDEWLKSYIYCDTSKEAKEHVRRRGADPKEYNFKCILNMNGEF